MEPPSEQLFVRSDYLHAIAGACQRFVGSLFLLEPGSFASSVRRLTSEAPVAESVAERVIGWTLLKETLVSGAISYHTWFHECVGPSGCDFHVHAVDCRLTCGPHAAITVLNGWAEAFTRKFDERHAWPPAIRAAAVLQQDPRKHWYVEALASTVAVSYATLERGFHRTYGVGVHEYLSLLRLRAIAADIRADNSCVEGLILGAGCRSPKDVYRTFRRLTGKTFAEVRGMTDADFASMMERALAVPLPRPRPASPFSTCRWKEEPATLKSPATENLRQLSSDTTQG
jgi:AraC-like DNA-binding protein